ncbi:MAG: DUF6339 family protein [Myxococcota bacterium]|nr:DUF6339 family protein [Myxococcota bacterium]
MERLMMLAPGAKPYVATALIGGAKKLDIDPKYLREFNRPLDVDPLRKGLEDVQSEYFQYEKEMDEEAVLVVRDTLPLTRREAAQIGVWHWLTVCCVPQFVWHRWPLKADGTPTTERFLGGLNKNTLARLWWLGELTRDTKDAALTKALVARTQDQVQLVQEHAFVKHAPAVRAFLALTESARFEEIREIAKLFSFVGTTVRLAALSEEAIIRLVTPHVPGACDRATRRGKKKKAKQSA